MLAEFRRALPGVRSVPGRAEAIPLPDASVDAVLAGQAMHWFDLDLAAPEIARVLVPGGVLAGLWNADDDREEWVAGFDAASGRAAMATVSRSPTPPPDLPMTRPGARPPAAAPRQARGAKLATGKADDQALAVDEVRDHGRREDRGHDDLEHDHQHRGHGALAEGGAETDPDEESDADVELEPQPDLDHLVDRRVELAVLL